MGINHQVKQGECVSSIAFEHGFSPDTIWGHPSNADLKKLRVNPNSLMPGDILFVPDKRIKEVSESTNNVHRFRVKNVPAKLRVQIKFNGGPLSGVEYSLFVDGKEVTPAGSRTDSEGFVNCSISPAAREGVLVVKDGGEEVEYLLNLGHLNPAAHLTGSKQRLFNLGFYTGPVDEKLDDATRDAIRSFQKSAGLEQTGELDSATRGLLEKAHDAK